MALTGSAARNAKPREKDYKLADGMGMYLLVTASGSKWWRIKYRFAGKEKSLSLGTYPETTLAAARVKRSETRHMLKNGIDPALQRKQQKSAMAIAATNSFEAVAREWHAKNKPRWSEVSASRTLTTLEQDVFPWIGSRPISEIKSLELLAVLRRVEERKVFHTAHRILGHLGQIMRYATSTGRAEHDVAAALHGSLVPETQVHHASIIDPKAVGNLLRDIDIYEGSLVTKCALRLATLVFLRPGELRRAEWTEIDFDAAEWPIPATKMKMGVVHIVPLSTQAQNILRELHPITKHVRYVALWARKFTDR